MKETENIKDLWICKKCGRFGYHKFYAHATHLHKMNFCTGNVVRFNTWKKEMRK